MSKKEVITTNTIKSKIYAFFRKVFFKNKYKEIEQGNFIESKHESQTFLHSISYRTKISDLNRKKIMAEKLMNGKLNIESLSDNDVDEMIEYFNVYIDDMNQELEQIKKHIINLKNKQ